MDIDKWVASNSHTLSIEELIKRGLPLPDELCHYHIARAQYPNSQDGRLRLAFEDALNAAIEHGDLAATSQVITHRYQGVAAYGNMSPPPVRITHVTKYVVQKDEFRRWLEAEGLPLPRWWFSDEEESAEPELNLQSESIKPSSPGKRERQIAAIIEALRAEGHDPMNIPEKVKGKLRDQLINRRSDLFTPSGFDHTWKEATKNKRIQVANIQKYRHS